MVNLVTRQDRDLVSRAIALLSEYSRNRDMIDIGAYRAGTNAELDVAVRAMPAINRFLRQDMEEAFTREQAMETLRAALGSANTNASKS